MAQTPNPSAPRESANDLEYLVELLVDVGKTGFESLVGLVDSAVGLVEPLVDVGKAGFESLAGLVEPLVDVGKAGFESRWLVWSSRSFVRSSRRPFRSSRSLISTNAVSSR